MLKFPSTALTSCRIAAASILVASVVLSYVLPASATIVHFETSLGNFDLRLYDTAMPRTVANFLHYVQTSEYNGSVVHRNSKNFVIQGGGYYLQDPVPPNTTITYSQVSTIAPIADEPGGGVAGISNLRGTIAMAKSGPNTVTSQWFINEGNNSILDSPTRADGGFAAFGAVLGNGMTVVDAIGGLPIPTDFGFSIGSPFNELPLRNFSGNSISQIRVANTVTVSQVRVLNYLAGDYDFNGTVNQADYTVWRSTLGSTTNAAADGNGNGKVDAADYVLWRKTLGQSGGPGAGSGSGLDSFGIPEPSSAALILLGSTMLTFYRGRFSARRMRSTR
jgi:cyclophilin family peptidyl-prolyl cis-trans isomerase